MNDKTRTLKVAGSTDARKLAGSIVTCFEDGAEKVQLISIGAIALNQAIKGYIQAKSLGAPKGWDITINISWTTLETTAGFTSALVSTLEK